MSSLDPKGRTLEIGLFAIASLFLTSCSLAPGSEKVKAAATAAIDTGISDRKVYNDKKAETLLALPCDISIGAFYRLTNSVQQEALAMLCSGRRVNDSEPQLFRSSTAP